MKVHKYFIVLQFHTYIQNNKIRSDKYDMYTVYMYRTILLEPRMATTLQLSKQNLCGLILWLCKCMILIEKNKGHKWKVVVSKFMCKVCV